jgi:hypothetical protein
MIAMPGNHSSIGAQNLWVTVSLILVEKKIGQSGHPSRVARYFLLQNTQTRKYTYQNDQEAYQRTI